jgi:hypothetical protein
MQWVRKQSLDGFINYAILLCKVGICKLSSGAYFSGFAQRRPTMPCSCMSKSKKIICVSGLVNSYLPQASHLSKGVTVL